MRLLRTAVFIDVDEFRLQAAKPTLDHDVVCPAGFAVRALADVKFLQKLLIFVTGELAALARFQDGGNAIALHGILDNLHDRLVSNVSDSVQPAILRLNQSITAVRYI